MRAITVAPSINTLFIQRHERRNQVGWPKRRGGNRLTRETWRECAYPTKEDSCLEAIHRQIQRPHNTSSPCSGSRFPRPCLCQQRLRGDHRHIARHIPRHDSGLLLRARRGKEVQGAHRHERRPTRESETRGQGDRDSTPRGRGGRHNNSGAWRRGACRRTPHLRHEPANRRVYTHGRDPHDQEPRR